MAAFGPGDLVGGIVVGLDILGDKGVGTPGGEAAIGEGGLRKLLRWWEAGLDLSIDREHRNVDEVRREDVGLAYGIVARIVDLLRGEAWILNGRHGIGLRRLVVDIRSAAKEDVLLRDVMIDPDGKLVHVEGLLELLGEGVGAVNPVGVIGHRIFGQDAGSHRVQRDLIREAIHQDGTAPLRLGRNDHGRRLTQPLAKAGVLAEEKGSIAEDGTAARDPKLIALERGRAGCRKIVAGIVCRIADELEGRAVELVFVPDLLPTIWVMVPPPRPYSAV